MASKGSTTQRGYGTAHQRLRKQLEPIVKSGQAQCWRCGQPIHPGQAWDLGHDDHDRTQYRGPEHALKQDCTAGGNRAAGARHSNRRRPTPPPPPAAPPIDTSKPW